MLIAELLEVNALFRLRAAQGVLGLADKNTPERLEAACLLAMQVGDASYKTAKGILAAGTTGKPHPPSPRGTAARRLTFEDQPPCSPSSPRRWRHDAVHQLESTLRSLKFSGMLDTLDARLVQARAGELGHQAFLQVLCEDELHRRAATAVTRRVRAARFEELASLEDFDFTVSAKLPVYAIRDLATLRFLERAESVVLHGPVGIGKSHVAQALGNLA